jgi:hypothetical protein
MSITDVERELTVRKDGLRDTPPTTSAQVSTRLLSTRTGLTVNIVVPLIIVINLLIHQINGIHKTWLNLVYKCVNHYISKKVNSVLY